MSHIRKYIVSALLLSMASGLAAERNEEESLRKTVSEIGFNFRTGYVFPSFRDDVLRESLSMDHAVDSRFANSFHIAYGFSFTDQTESGRIYPGTVQGIGASLNLFQHPGRVGLPVSVYLFQGAPVWRINHRLLLDYSWNFGVSAGWKPCDGKTALSSVIVGSGMNAYINLGIGMRWLLDNHYSLTAGVELTHYSNGNTSFPNPGVNTAGLKIGVIRSFGRQETSTPFLRDTRYKEHHISYDLTAYGAWRRRVYRGGETPVLLKGHYAVAGLTFAPMWDIKRYFRAGVSADFQWDRSSDLKRYHIGGSATDDIRFGNPPFFSQMSAGLSARAELVMPIFSVNVGIGYNFIGPPEARASYQMANLKIRVIDGCYINIGYQLQNFQRQNNLMLGMGYTFRSLSKNTAAIAR